MKEWIRYRGKKRGWVENKAYYSERRSPEHYFRNFSGWGNSLAILEELERRSIKKIFLIIDYGNYKIEIVASLNKIFSKGKEYKDAEDDWQIILNEKYWQESGYIKEVQGKLF